jgi:hypothetical protein
MSQYAIDPELAQRRLRTLVRLLETEAGQQDARRENPAARKLCGELDSLEMREWARQCTNLLNGPVRTPLTRGKAGKKSLEDMTDEELLS